jgi:hypothetical protein
MMQLCGALLAWIKPEGTGQFVGAFVGEDAAPGRSRNFPGREPAAQLFSSRDDARRCIEGQGAAVRLPIKWVTE